MSDMSQSSLITPTIVLKRSLLKFCQIPWKC